MPEELLARLQNLENSYYGDKEAARQKQFFDTYGARFSNNHGLGLAILNELDARGIDTSAADEAVQQILDQLRTECNEIIESIKEVQEEAIQNAQKVEAIAGVVDQAAAANPDIAGAMMPEQTPEGAPLPPDMEQMPEQQMPEEQPEQMPEEQPEQTPEEQPEQMPEEQIPEEQPPVPSDERIKKIRTTLSDVRMKRIKASSYKPSSGVLAACSRGY